jgi:hypothetical protein
MQRESALQKRSMGFEYGNLKKEDAAGVGVRSSPPVSMVHGVSGESGDSIELPTS